MSRILTDDCTTFRTPLHCAAVFSSSEEDSSQHLFAVVHSFVTEPRDAWSVSAACIERFLRARPLRAISRQVQGSQQVYQHT